MFRFIIIFILIYIQVNAQDKSENVLSKRSIKSENMLHPGDTFTGLTLKVKKFTWIMAYSNHGSHLLLKSH